MLAQRNIEQLVTEIDRLYLVLVKTNYSPAETAKTVNSILLTQGTTSMELWQAWDEWFSAHRGRKNDSE